MVRRQGNDMEEGWAGLRANRKVRVEDKAVLSQQKDAQAIGLASQSDRQKSDGQTGDEIDRCRQTDRSEQADERWRPSRPCSVLNSGLLGHYGDD
jgi:hypothetical protein